MKKAIHEKRNTEQNKARLGKYADWQALVFCSYGPIHEELWVSGIFAFKKTHFITSHLLPGTALQHI